MIIFRKYISDYLRGKLKKVISLGSSTGEWCRKSFQKRYNDVVYISANPFINSKVEVQGFSAKKHFHRVIDVWDWGWDENPGTVHPKNVNKAMQKHKDDYPNKRFIIHYLQPHAPYLVYKLRVQPGRAAAHARRMRALLQPPFFIKEKSLLKRLHACVHLARHIRKRLFGERVDVFWNIRKLLKLPPASYAEAVRRRFGNSGLREAYVQNLRLVLKYVARLVENLHGVIIITSDHGERLGDRGAYSHRSGLSDPLLLEVPWLRIEKVVRTKKRHEENPFFPRVCQSQ